MTFVFIDDYEKNTFSYQSTDYSMIINDYSYKHIYKKQLDRLRERLVGTYVHITNAPIGALKCSLIAFSKAL